MPLRSETRWNARAVPERVRLRAHTKWAADGDCWISTYSTASHGYAQIGWQDGEDRGVVLAHRASWEQTNGPVPIGMTLDHLCKSRRCVNPGHLRVLPNHENARRTSGRDWPLGQCAHGHPNSELYTQPSGKRVCRPCKKVWQNRYYARQRSRKATP